MSHLPRKAKGLMNDQIAAGPDLVSHVAESVKGAAENLDQNASQIAGLMREAAERFEGSFGLPLRQEYRQGDLSMGFMRGCETRH
jgi:hypothetical protein